MKRNTLIPRTLGIIGGMGPIADSAFLDILHTYTDCACDQEHIPVIYDGNCLRPDRSDFLTKRSRSPYKSILTSMRSLEKSGANVIALPCNTAHCFLPTLYKQKRRRTVLLNMVHQSALACQKNGFNNVCILCTQGTKKADLYGDDFFRMGIDHIYPDGEILRYVTEFIKAVKSGKRPPFEELEDRVRGISCDAFLVACTELSYALHKCQHPTLNYVDGLSCLAKKALIVCGKKARSIPYT